jgi:hypothetical protein
MYIFDIYLYSDNNKQKKNIMKNFFQKQNYQIIAGQLIAVYFLIQLIFRA